MKKRSNYKVLTLTLAGLLSGTLVAEYLPLVSADENPLKTEPECKSYEEALLRLQPDIAISYLTKPLVKALSKGDSLKASRIMRLIAYAFRLDENDSAAASAADFAWKLDPGNEACAFQLAEYLFRDGKYAESERIYKRIIETGNEGSRLRAQAFLTQQTGAISKGTELLEKHLQTSENDEQALLRLSFLYLADEENEKAASLQRKLASLAKSEYLKEIYLGRAAESEHKFEQAEQHFLNAGRQNSKDPLWQGQLALMFMKQQKIEKAKEAFLESFKCKRLNSQIHTHWAVMQAFFGSANLAFACLDHLEKLRPNSSEMYFVRGIVCEKTGRLKEASECFHKALKLNPHNSSPYIHLLQSKEAQENLDFRIKLAREWAEGCPHSATAAIELGNALKSKGDKTEALKSYLRAESMLAGRKPPKDHNYLISICTMHSSIASLLYLNGDRENALKQALLFNKLRPAQQATVGLTMRPPKTDLSTLKDKAKLAAEHALLADCLYESRNLQDAEKEYRQALKEEPNNITYRSCLLKVLLDKRDYAAAIAEDAAVSQHLVTHVGDFFK